MATFKTDQEILNFLQAPKTEQPTQTFSSDEEISNFLGASPQPQTLPQQPTQQIPEDTRGEFRKGLASGVSTTGALLGDALPALFYSAIGDKEEAQRQLEEYQTTLQSDLAANPAKVSTYKDVDSLGDAWDYAARAVGEGAISIGAGIASGGVGALVGGLGGAAAKQGAAALAKKGIKELAEDFVAKKAIAGATVGTVAAGAAQNIPESYVNLAQEGVDSPTAAVIAGGLKTSLDVLPQLAILKKVVPNGDKVTDAVSDKLLSNVFKQAVQSGWQEGLTEAAQEAVDQAALAFLADNKEMFTRENLDNLIDAGLKGGLTGAAVGGITGSIETKQADRQIEQEALQATPEEFELQTDADIEAFLEEPTEQTQGRQEVEATGIETEVEAQPEQIKEALPTTMSENWSSEEEAGLIDTDKLDEYDRQQEAAQQVDDIYSTLEVKKEDREDFDDFKQQMNKELASALPPGVRYQMKSMPDVKLEERLEGFRKEGFDVDSPVYYADDVAVQLFDPIMEAAQGVDMQGPGYYLSSNKEQTTNNSAVPMYVKKENFITEDTTITEDVLREIVQKSPALEQTLTKMFPTAESTEQALDSYISALPAEKGVEATQKIWKDLYRESPEVFVNAMTEAGFDGREGVDAQGNAETVLYNPAALKTLDGSYEINPAQPDTMFQKIYSAEELVSVPDRRAFMNNLEGQTLSVGLNPRTLQDLAPLTFDLYKTVKKVGGKDVAVEFVNDIYSISQGKASPARGIQFADTVRLAMDYSQNPQDFQETAFHETWHYLREQTSVFSKDEDLILERANDYMREQLVKEFDMDPRDVNRLPNYEIEATYFGQYARKKTFGQPIDKQAQGLHKLFDKVLEILKAIADAFKQRGFSEFSDIFDSVIAGERAEDAVYRAGTGLRTFRQMQAVQRDDKQRLRKFMESVKPIPEPTHFTREEVEQGQLQGMLSSLNWLRSFPSLASSSPIFAKYVNTFNNHQEDLGNIQKYFSSRLQPLMQDRKTFKVSSDIISHLRSTNQNIRKDSEGRLVYRRGDRVVAAPKEISDAVTEITDLYKDVMRLFDQYSREVLVGFGLNENMTTEEILAEADRLREESKSADTDEAKIKMKERAESLVRLTENLDQIRGIIDSDKPYVPRMRFGSYAVFVYDKEGQADKPGRPGELVGMYTVEENFKGVPDKKELAEVQKKIKEKYGDSKRYDIQGMTKPIKLTKNAITDKIPSSLVTAELISSLMSSGNDSALTDLVAQIKADTGAKGIQKHFLASKDLDGFSDDWERVNVAYFSSISHQLANLRYAPSFAKMEAQIDTAGFNDKTRDELRDYYEYVTSPKPDMVRTRQLNFMYTMGLNLSTAALQLTTLPTTTVANMTQWDGNILMNNGRVLNGLKDATRLISYTGKEGDLSSEAVIKKGIKSGALKVGESELMTKAFNLGKLQAALTEDWLGGTAFERKGVSRKLTEGLEKTGQILSAPIAVAEQASRVASLLATFRSLNTDRKISKALETFTDDQRFQEAYANKGNLTDREFISMYSVEEAHAIFGKLSRGKAQRGIFGSLIMPFMTHPQQIMELMYRQAFKRGTAGRRAAAYHVFAFLMLAGLQGIPGMDMWEEMYKIYHKIFKGTMRDLMNDIRMGMVEMGIDPKTSATLTKGPIYSYGGVDIAKRVGMPIFFQDPLMMLMKIGTGETAKADEVLGVPGSVLANFGKALSTGAQGESAQAVAKEIVPVAFSNMYEGLIEYRDKGVSTGRGTRLLNPEEITAGDALTKAFGFTPSRVSERRAQQRAFTLADPNKRVAPGLDRFRGQMAKVQENIIRARRSGADDEEVQKLVDKRRELNKELVKFLKENEYPITKDFWTRFRNSVRDRLKQRFSPQTPSGVSKRTDIRGVRDVYDYEN